MSSVDNTIYGPLHNMRLILSKSSTFQTLVGHAADATATFDHTYCPMIAGDAVVAARPFGLVDFGNKADYTRLSTDNFKVDGTVMLQIDVAFPSDVTLNLVDPTETERAEAGHLWYSELLGDIFDELIELSDDGTGNLHIMSIRQHMAPMRTMKEDLQEWGDAYLAIYEIGYR